MVTHCTCTLLLYINTYNIAHTQWLYSIYIIVGSSAAFGTLLAAGEAVDSPL